MFFYVKALHIVFVVTWFSGMFYIVRLFIYNTEAQEKTEVERKVLTAQFSIMIRRLWLGITWPSAVLTLIFGAWMASFYHPIPLWLWIKLGFVLLLYLYHFTLQNIYTEQMKGNFRHASGRLRVWNEVATILLVAIVMLATVKRTMSWVWGTIGLLVFVVLLMSAIKIYKLLREKR